MYTQRTKEEVIAAFRKAKQRKKEWEQRMDKKLAALEAEMIGTKPTTV